MNNFIAYARKQALKEGRTLLSVRYVVKVYDKATDALHAEYTFPSLLAMRKNLAHWCDLVMDNNGVYVK